MEEVKCEERRSGRVSEKCCRVIESLIKGVDLSEGEAESCLGLLLNEANVALISAVLVLLRTKGDTVEEVVGLAKAMMKHSMKVQGLVDVVDIVGTGGDGANTVNISTGASILAAACGVNVAKNEVKKRDLPCRFLQQTGVDEG